jgi:sec-independent protein translocase protein TatB
MFDIGWSELLVIGIVALIAIGPKELPGVLRGLGQWMGKIRRMASDFQDQFREAMREAEVADLKKQFDDAANSASNLTGGFENPLDTARKEVEKALGEEPDPAALSGARETPPADANAPAAPAPTVSVEEVAGAVEKLGETKPGEAVRGSDAA